jgi:ribosomal protein L28
VSVATQPLYRKKNEAVTPPLPSGAFSGTHFSMTKSCTICGKQKSVGHTRKLLRGHRNITGKRDFKPNLQKVSYRGTPVLACTRCIRTINKTGKISSTSGKTEE